MRKKEFEFYTPEELEAYVPSTLEEMINYLEYLFPWKVFDKTTTDREIWISVGQQKLIQFLKDKQEGLD
jgi:hypothetical protein